MITGSSYVFINSNEHIDFSKAITNKFINIGGIGVPKPKPLSMVIIFSHSISYNV
jgi:hypothetical protein